MNLRPYDEPIYTRVRKDHELIDARLFSRCIDERRVKTVAVRILEVPAELCGVILVNWDKVVCCYVNGNKQLNYRIRF